MICTVRGGARSASGKDGSHKGSTTTRADSTVRDAQDRSESPCASSPSSAISMTPRPRLRLGRCGSGTGLFGLGVGADVVGGLKASHCAGEGGRPCGGSWDDTELIESSAQSMLDESLAEAASSLDISCDVGTELSAGDMIPSGARGSGSSSGWSPATAEGCSRRRKSRRRSISELSPSARMTPPELEHRGLGIPWQRPASKICTVELQADEAERARQFCLVPSPELNRNGHSRCAQSPPRTPGSMQRQFLDHIHRASMCVTPGSGERSGGRASQFGAGPWSGPATPTSMRDSPVLPSPIAPIAPHASMALGLEVSPACARSLGNYDVDMGLPSPFSPTPALRGLSAAGGGP